MATFLQKLTALPALAASKILKSSGEKYSMINAGDPDFPPQNVEPTLLDLPHEKVALTLLALSSIIYENRKICEEQLAAWKYDQVQLFNFPKIGEPDYFSHELNQAFLCANSEYVVMTFRGTETMNIWDWLQDFDFRLIPVEPAGGIRGRVHAGFWTGMNWRAPPLLNAILKTLDEWEAGAATRRPLYITGHSLGGALSVIAAAGLAQRGLQGLVTGVYTFGQPRVGDREFVTSVHNIYADRFFRYVHHNDVVPRQPFNKTGFYEPLGRCIYLRNGKLIKRDRGLQEAPVITPKKVAKAIVHGPVDFFRAVKEGVSGTRAAAIAMLPESALHHFPWAYTKQLVLALDVPVALSEVFGIPADLLSPDPATSTEHDDTMQALADAASHGLKQALQQLSDGVPEQHSSDATDAS
eukprot:TRINITY_DN4517_c0_g1_i1.p1 TRINITY_DN4517_c0_g1~~TRINITY_DN4517_c0_g1_i1.p1  ORF type:complete len:431 (-),score=96.64 TRINITY_DN4517_c0_g1_i1:392-1624(-)